MKLNAVPFWENPYDVELIPVLATTKPLFAQYVTNTISTLFFKGMFLMPISVSIGTLTQMQNN